jgi:Prophage endopeptidase tail/Prophage endopeptidase tail N-terminal domain
MNVRVKLYKKEVENLADLIVTNITGQSEILTDYSNLTRNKRVNGNRSLSFFVAETDRNKHTFPLVTEESIVEYDGVEYRIKNVDERTIAQTPVKSVTASHVFFDIIDDFQYAVLSDGDKSINEALSLALANTGYTFSVIDSFGTVKLEGFGNDTALALFQTILERYQAEFDIVGTDVKIYAKIGSSPDFQFRYRHNVKTFNKTVNTNNLSTYIKGYGKEVEGVTDKLSGVSMNYTSRTGTWIDVDDPHHYTKQVGATFTFSFTGTGFKFRFYGSPDGGVWEFATGDKKAKVSTWSATEGTKGADVFRGLESKTHVVTATFKGDDPKHVPSTGKNTARGWVAHDLSGSVKTVDLYRALEGDELFTCVSEYTSPESTKYKDRNGNVKLRHAPPVYSDTITSATVLLSALKKAIIDKPEITFELEFVELQNGGFAVSSPRLGDTVPTIYEPLNVDVDLRILEIEDYPETTKSPKVTLSNVKKRFSDVQFNRVKAILDKIWDENSGKLKTNVYTEAVKKATEALNNSLTELEYPVGMGIIARDPNDASRFTILRSAGLGITTNGGETYDNAVTPDGITTNLLTAGQIKTNNIQIIGNDDLFYWDGTKLIAIDAADPNKYAQLNSDGLYIAKGAITIERPDGYKVITDGLLNYDLDIQGTEPPFTSGSVEISRLGYGQWWGTTLTTSADCQYYSYEHKARYLKLQVRVASEAGNTAYLTVESGGLNNTTLAVASTTETNINAPEIFDTKTLTIDLGVPTGERRNFYVRIKSSDPTKKAYGHVIRKWLEG